jgi:cytochrome b561
MSKATRVGSKLDQQLARASTASRSMSGGHQQATDLGGDTVSDAVIAPAYTITARVLHWITAFLILSMIPLGIVIARDWGGSAQDFLYDLHRSIGAAVIPLVILRLIYRWAHPPLPLPDNIAAIQRRAAHATHWSLYALLIVQPFTGWIATSAYRAPVIVFGLFELPPIWPENRAFSEQLFSVHNLIGIAIACLAAAHIAAALYHHFVRKDRILMRMIG